MYLLLQFMHCDQRTALQYHHVSENMVRVGKGSSCVALELCLIRNGAKIFLKFPYDFMKIFFRFILGSPIFGVSFVLQTGNHTGLSSYVRLVRQQSYLDFERKKCSATQRVKIAKKVHKPPLGVNVINFEFNASIWVPQTNKIIMH